MPAPRDPAPESKPEPFAIWQVVILLLVLSADCVALDPEREIQQLGHTRWTLEQGIPGQVGALAQTSDGHLWLSAGQSLLRFDGLQFERMGCQGGFRDASDVEAPDCGTVSAMLATDDGSLWLGMRGGDVVQIDQKRIQRYGSQHGLPGGVVYDLARDHQGRIWAASEGGLARYDGSSWIAAQTLGVTGPARALLLARDGAVWVATAKQLLRLPLAGLVFADTGVRVESPGELVQAPDGNIWLSERTTGTVQAVADASGQPVSGIALPLQAFSVLFDHDGALWAGTLGDGVRRVVAPLSGSPTQIQTFNRQQGLSGDFVSAVLEDREGNVWVGSAGGLDRFRNSPVVRAQLPEGIHNLALAASGDGHVWIGSSNRPVLLLDQEQVRAQTLTASVHSVWADPRSERVWLATAAQLWHGDASTLHALAPWPVRADGATHQVRSMTRDAQGTLWISLDRQGLFTYTPSHGWCAVEPWGAGDEQKMPVIATSDAHGQPWFGYRNNLLVHVLADGSVQRWTATSGLALGAVTAIAHGADGQVWLGGTHGLARVHQRQVIMLDVTGPTPPQTVHGLIATTKGELWVHAANGLLRIDATAVARNLADPGVPLAAMHVSGLDGMAENPLQIRPLPTAVQASDGRLWFATSTGAAWLDPDRLYEDRSPPPVLIKSLSADSQKFHASTSLLRLPANTQRVSLRFAAMRLADPPSLRLRYRLLGFEQEWREAGAAREAVYTALDPGSYRFEVAAAAPQGSFGTALASQPFVVQPSLYQHWAFRLSCGLLALALLYLVYQLRLRQLAARLQLALDARLAERERIARELHDTLLQGFHGLLLRFHAASTRLPTDDPARRALDHALDHGEGVLVEARERITLMRVNPPSAQLLVQSLAELGQDLARGSNTRFMAHVGTAPVEPDPLVRDELCMIVREGLVNAFRHARAKLVELHVEGDSAALSIHISDDGIGIDPAVLANGRRAGRWGLPGMRERALRIGAQLEVRQRDAGGTEVLLSLPCRRRSAPL